MKRFVMLGALLGLLVVTQGSKPFHTAPKANAAAACPLDCDLSSCEDPSSCPLPCDPSQCDVSRSAGFVGPVLFDHADMVSVAGFTPAGASPSACGVDPATCGVAPASCGFVGKTASASVVSVASMTPAVSVASVAATTSAAAACDPSCTRTSCERSR